MAHKKGKYIPKKILIFLYSSELKSCYLMSNACSKYKEYKVSHVKYANIRIKFYKEKLKQVCLNRLRNYIVYKEDIGFLDYINLN